MHFDTHGNLTAMVTYTPSAEQGTMQQNASYTFVNKYDAHERLQHATLTVAQQDTPPVKIEAERSYDAQGRLCEMRAVCTDLSANRNRR